MTSKEVEREKYSCHNYKEWGTIIGDSYEEAKQD